MEQIRTDNRLDEMPMVPVTCGSCDARVLARKGTWNQTSVQWNADATARCAERMQAQQMSVSKWVMATGTIQCRSDSGWVSCY